MPSYKSDLTNKSFQGPQMRSLEVPDASEEMYDYSQDQGPVPNSSELDIAAINARLASRGLPPLDGVGERAVAARSVQTRAPQHPQPDQTEALRAFENEVSMARKVKATGRERLGDAAKRRIEMLCGLFNDTKTVDINGQVFELRVLVGKEIRESLISASVHDGTVALPFETRKQFLARSLTLVAGTEIEMFLGDDSIEARTEFVDRLPEPILIRLFSEYQALDNDTRTKYAMRTAADAQEVAADLKK